MAYKIPDATYTTSLALQHNTTLFSGGLCFSRLGLEDLRSIQSDFLHPKEQAYFSTFQYPKRQHSYLLGRYCAKQALTVCAAKQPATEIWIENGVFQQPVAYHLMLNNLQVSISHTDTLGAALAFPEAHPMALDVETTNGDKDDVILTQLSTGEQKLAASLSNSPPLQLLWTIKEALSKVLKCGLTVPFDLLEVESIAQQHEMFFISCFKNFSQYHAISFLLPEAVCSIVYPKKTELKLDLLSLDGIVRG